MENKMLTLSKKQLPDRLMRIDSPPNQLFYTGEPLDNLLKNPCVAIVGSRAITPYGREVTTNLARELARRGVVIISGLALGVDAIAHRACLEAGGQSIAVLPSPVDKIYPASHSSLARTIVDSGGCLVSEYPTGTNILKINFIARNRLVSALSDALLITEAAEKSGSLHTARFALAQGKDVLAVPGNITSKTSVGTNNLIRSGAQPVLDVSDVLFALGMDDREQAEQRILGSDEEKAILSLIVGGIRDGEALQAGSELDIAVFNQTLTMLEITGKIRSIGPNQWGLS